jgi:hypothetical protein
VPLRLPLVALIVVLVASACLGSGTENGSGESQKRVAGTRARLVDLDLDRFRASFNEAAGKPRLLLLFSPT